MIIIILYMFIGPNDCEDVQYVRFSTKSFEEIAMDYLFSSNINELVSAMFSIALLSTDAAFDKFTNCTNIPE